MSSKPAGGKPLQIGSTVQALETRVNPRGVVRVRLEQGWVSETAGDGTILLQRVEVCGRMLDELVRPKLGKLLVLRGWLGGGATACLWKNTD